MGSFSAWHWAIFLAIAYVIYRVMRGNSRGGANRYCKACGTTAPSRTRTRGSFVMEIVLWICFIVPGLIYSIWRLTTRQEVCSACGSTGLIPTDSPIAIAAREGRKAD
jgi:hypothetical protein